MSFPIVVGLLTGWIYFTTAVTLYAVLRDLRTLHRLRSMQRAGGRP